MNDYKGNPIISHLQKKMETEVMKYAVGNAITCSMTGEVLDYRTATFVETEQGGLYPYTPRLTEDRWTGTKEALEAEGIKVKRIFNLKTLKQ